MKALKYILYGLVILGAAGLLAYQGLVTKNLESGNLARGILIIAAAVVGMFRPKRRGQVTNKKALYQKTYAEFLQNSFADQPKLEKQLYNAIHLYNISKPAAAVSKLTKLRKECQRTADIYAVTVFLGLCYDDMGLFNDALTQYNAALKIRPTSTVWSNMGLCHQRLGQKDDARKAYENAIALDPHNAFAYNNLSALYFRDAEYYDALEYAQLALKEDPNMPQALSTAALCCGMLNDQEGYEKYYRLAVANGYDGRRIKATLQRIQEECEDYEKYKEDWAD